VNSSVRRFVSRSLARSLFASGTLAVTGAFLAPGLALAQEPAAESGGLEEVVISARFREEPLQRTPLAVTAITGESLELRNATNVVDIGKFSPNVTINPLGAGYGPTLVANIRGVGLTDFKPVFEPGVPIYVDDVVLARSTGAVLDLLDLERVEVLRGPQGTLFGKNAAGGAIRMVSRKPTGDGPGFIEGTYGKYNRIDFRGAFETTLVQDKVFGRFSFSSKKRDGYVDVLDFACEMTRLGTPGLAGTLPRDTAPRGSGNGCKIDEMGGEDVQAARAAFRFVASDDFEINLIGDVTDDNSKGPADKTLDIQTDGSLVLLNRFNQQVAGPRYGVQFDKRFITNDPFTSYATFEDPINGLETPNISHVFHWGVSGTADWNISDALSMKVILAHRKFDAEFGRDTDGSPLPINHTFDRFVHEQDSAEVRFSGQLFGTFTDWTAGGFYFDATDFQPNFVILYPNETPAFPQALIDRIDNQESENWAVFLHTVNHLTDAMNLTVGVRYTNDEKEFTVIRSQQADGSLLFPITTATAEASRTTPMASLSYQFNPTLNSYVSWQRGFRGGGFNPRPASAAQVTSFAPEDLDSYEVGLKSEWLDRRLRLNLAAFYVKYTDLQLPSVFVDANNAVTFPPLNAGKARMDGVELEFQANVFEGFHIDGAVGYLGFQYQDLGRADPDFIRNNSPPQLTPAQREQNARAAPCKECRPLRSPEWTGSLGLQYTAPLAGRGSLTFRTDASYQSRVFYSANNIFRASQKAYTLVDANIGWTSEDDSWTVALSGTNLTDKLYLNGALDFMESLGTNEGQYGRPREWAVSVKRRF
jgi:iron complex outermembrane receptor protein